MVVIRFFNTSYMSGIYDVEKNIVNLPQSYFIGNFVIF